VQNIQPTGIFQCKIFSQQEYSSAKYSVSREISAQNIQSVGRFQYNISVWEIFIQQRYSSTKCSVGRDIPVQNIQPTGMFQPKYSVNRNMPVQNIQSTGIFQYKIYPRLFRLFAGQGNVFHGSGRLLQSLHHVLFHFFRVAFQLFLPYVCVYMYVCVCVGKEGRKEGRIFTNDVQEGYAGQRVRKDIREGRTEERKKGRKEERKEGRKIGREEERKEGRKRGWKEGRKGERKEGRKEGRKAGRQAGRKEGRYLVMRSRFRLDASSA
jgi:hypothetical protein